MNRFTLVVTCLAALTLAACGDGGKKPMTVRDKSNVKPVDVGSSAEKSVQETSDPSAGTGSKP